MIKAGLKTKSVLKNIEKASAAADKEHHGKFRQDSVTAEHENESDNTPTFSPKDFDTFIPWACKQWTACTSVIIIRKAQAHYVRVGEKKTTTRGKKTKLKDAGSSDSIDESSGPFNKKSSTSSGTGFAAPLPVIATYDDHSELVEISIVGSPVKTPTKIIRAIGLSVPYHSSLTRFTFRRSGLTAQLVYEINKLLLISNISEIIFDDSFVPEGNYYILLEQSSHLRYLSLNRCNINNEVCKKLFENIRFDAPAARTLQILELGSNRITDDGAQFIGSVLRTNRCLVHLNLSGNQITDRGFLRILDSLMEFPLNFEESHASIRRKYSYLQNKMAVYTKCLNDLKTGHFEDLDIGSGSTCGRKGLMKRLRLKEKETKKSQIDSRPIEDDAEKMTLEIVGNFFDPFSPNLLFKNGVNYCQGNLVLCSLNIAYNGLEYASLKKLTEVLQYQEDIAHNMSSKETGLIRIILDGNKIPETCSELCDIDLYLHGVVKFAEMNKPTDGKRKVKGLSHKKSFFNQPSVLRLD